MGFPGGSAVKNSPADVGDVDLISGLGASPGGGNGNPLQYSCLEIPTDRGAWWGTVHGVAKSRTRLGDSMRWGQKDPLEKEMTTHSNILAWEIPWTEEPGGLQSMGSPKSQTQ